MEEVKTPYLHIQEAAEDRGEKQERAGVGGERQTEETQERAGAGREGSEAPQELFSVCARPGLAGSGLPVPCSMRGILA